MQAAMSESEATACVASPQHHKVYDPLGLLGDEKKLRRGLSTAETEATSTVDTEGDYASDNAGDLMQEMEEEEEMEELTIIDDPFALVDSCSEASEDPSDADSSFDLRSPDPFDYMPPVRARPAFSEREVAEALARRRDLAQPEALPGISLEALARGAPVATPEMQAAAEMQVMSRCVMSSNGMMWTQQKCVSRSTVVPVPVPMSAAMFQPALPNSGAPQVPVFIPKGYKLVPIPGANPGANLPLALADK
jgi:hypothetical protein